ncbi:MAG: 50S ribosomal protein L23 [Nitrososphaerota archaeon]|nr:50S ribosomal protein L23 [Nitrososphaerota archaeon]MDG6939495.1 50S ribosomal protein L23 [Nitrososphaerota archaeon]
MMPYVTEKTFGLIERENKLVFMVNAAANKRTVKEAVEAMYEVKVEKVNIMTAPKGKKAYVTLSRETPASELASKLGVL